MATQHAWSNGLHLEHSFKPIGEEKCLDKNGKSLDMLQ